MPFFYGTIIRNRGFLQIYTCTDECRRETRKNEKRNIKKSKQQNKMKGTKEMKKRLLSLALASLTAVSSFAFCAFAAEPMSYSDVPADHRYYDGIKAAYERGYMNGVGGGKFEPDEPLSRAMLVTILYRAEGEPAFMNDLVFTDVERDSWYEKAVVWAQGKSIVHGTTKTTFEPNENITREQLATILYRYCEYREFDIASVTADTNTLSYEDIFTVAEYAAPGMHFCLASGAIEGDADGRVRPAEAATRAEAAKALVTTVDLFSFASMSNPIVETDAESLRNTLGLFLGAPEGAQNVRYSIIGGTTAQVNYDFGGAACTARILPSAELTDVSGMFYEWSASQDFAADRVTGSVKVYDGEDSDCVAVIMFDPLPGLSYSFTAAGADLSKFDYETALLSTFEFIDQSAEGESDGGATGMVGIANPVKASSMEEIGTKFGVQIKTPAKANGAAYSIISDTIGQLSFTLDGAECNTRVKKAAAAEDISGVYLSEVQYSEDFNEAGFKGSVNFGTVSGKPCVVIIAHNDADGNTYSFSALGANATKIDIEGLVAEMFF